MTVIFSFGCVLKISSNPACAAISSNWKQSPWYTLVWSPHLSRLPCTEPLTQEPFPSSTIFTHLSLLSDIFPSPGFPTPYHLVSELIFLPYFKIFAGTSLSTAANISFCSFHSSTLAYFSRISASLNMKFSVKWLRLVMEKISSCTLAFVNASLSFEYPTITKSSAITFFFVCSSFYRICSWSH